MMPAARLAPAIEVFASIEGGGTTAARRLKWGRAHRFAGSSDRAAIAGLVYDALRRRASSAYVMGAETPRAILLGMLKRERGLDVDAIAKPPRGARAGRAASEHPQGRPRQGRRAARRSAAGALPLVALGPTHPSCRGRQEH